jgi:hypothetical protein
MVQTRQSTRQNSHYKKNYGLTPKEMECARILLSMKEKTNSHNYNLRPSKNISYRGMDGETEWFKQTRYNLRIR